jgi:YD repeat-containing protein
LALSALFAFSVVLVTSQRAYKVSPVHAAGNWSGGSAPGSGQAPWEIADSGVNIANGNLMVGAGGPTIPGVNRLDEIIRPTYNSVSSNRATDMGNGWTLGTGRDVGLDLSTPGAATFYGATGHGYTFTEPNSCTFTSPPGVDAQLVCSGTGYTLTVDAPGLQYKFDNGGNLTALQNRQGNQIAFAYSGSGQLTQITNTEGQTTTVSYDTQNRISQITEPGTPSRTWTYAYDANGNLSQVTDPANHATGFGYDAASHLTKVTDPIGNVTTISYDANNRVSQIVNVTNKSTNTGPTTSFTYGAGSTQVTDANNHTTVYGFDASNRVISYTDPLNRATQLTWTIDNRVASEKFPSGATTTYTYDANNNLTQVTSPTGVTKTLQYGDSSHPYLPTSITDGQGSTNTIQYNAQGLPTSVTNAQNHTRTATYNANGTVASTADANSHQTTYTYNSLGLLTKVTPPSPLGSTSYSYDGYDRVSGMTDGKGQSTGYSYDAVDHPLSAAYADGSSVTYTYDGDGNQLSTDGELTGSGPGSQETVSNGSFEGGQSPWQTVPTTSNIVKYNPGQGQGGDNRYAELQSEFSNPEEIWQTVSVPSSYSKLTFSYWLRVPPLKNGACSAFTVQIRTTGGSPITTLSNPCPSGYTSGWAQESVDLTMTLAAYKGKQVQVYFQDFTTGGAQAFELDTVSLLAATDKTTYTYNALNQETQQAIQNGVTTNMTWDNVGNLLSKTDSSGTVTYTYDAADELTTATDQWGGKTTFSYDVDGNRTQITYPNGAGQQLTYNSAGQPTRLIAQSSTGGTLASMSWRYTNPSTNAPTDLPWSTTDIDGNSTTNSYDTANQLTQSVRTNSSGGTIASYSYGYDAVGNITSITENGLTTLMAYNAANELTKGGSKTYSYDGNGSRTGDSAGTQLGYNAADQTSFITPSAGPLVPMAYSGAGQTQRVGAGSKVYNHDLTGLSSYYNGTTTTYFMSDPSGTPVDYHVNGNTYWYLVNPIDGSIAGVFDSSGQVMTNELLYTPTGEVVNPSTLNPNDPLGFGGHIIQDGSGLDNTGSGYYDPSTGQSTQQSCDAYGGAGMCMQFGDYNPFDVSPLDQTAGSDKDGFFGCDIYPHIGETNTTVIGPVPDMGIGPVFDVQAIVYGGHTQGCTPGKRNRYTLQAFLYHNGELASEGPAASCGDRTYCFTADTTYILGPDESIRDNWTVTVRQCVGRGRKRRCVSESESL